MNKNSTPSPTASTSTPTDPAIEARALVHDIAPLLHGRDPGIVGAALADLTAMLIAGHHPVTRAGLMKRHFALVRALVPINHEIIMQPFGGRWPDAE
jgi:hypothetical protein